MSIATGLLRPDRPVWQFPAGRAVSNKGRGEEYELSKKRYVGNLPFSTTEEELRAAFERHGSVASANVARRRMG